MVHEYQGEKMVLSFNLKKLVKTFPGGRFHAGDSPAGLVDHQGCGVLGAAGLSGAPAPPPLNRITEHL